MLMEYQCTKSNTEIFTMIYEGDLCIGEIKGDSIQVSDAKKKSIYHNIGMGQGQI